MPSSLNATRTEKEHAVNHEFKIRIVEKQIETASGSFIYGFLEGLGRHGYFWSHLHFGISLMNCLITTHRKSSSSRMLTNANRLRPVVLSSLGIVANWNRLP